MRALVRTTNVVLADEEAVVRYAIVRLLERERDLRVVAEAKNGAEALKQVEECEPSVLLLSSDLSQPDAVEVLRQLASAPIGITTIVMLRWPNASAVHEALRLGARGAILRANIVPQLIHCIRGALSGQCWIDGAMEPAGHNYRYDRRQTNFSVLTSRERQIVDAIVEGNSNLKIAQRLSISEETVKRHLANIYGKVLVSSRLELAMLAVQQGIGSVGTAAIFMGCGALNYFSEGMK